MGKIKSYLYVIAVISIVVISGYFMNIGEINTFFNMCLRFVQQNMLSVTAAVCAFVFLGNKNYWLIIAGCAVITAAIIHFFVIGHNVSGLAWCARIVSFVAIVFLMNFAKLLINK